MENTKKAFGRTVAALAAGVSVLCLLLTASIAAAAAGGLSEREKGAEADAVSAKHVYDPLADGSVIRLHVIANSDSERDQSIKLAVRDTVIEYERTQGADVQGAFSAENALRDGGAGLLAAVRDTLKRYGAEYDAQLELGEFEFPEREYGETLYPSGRYRALRVLLGNAEGRNWWCILFPPLCLIENPAGPDAGEAGTNTSQQERADVIRFESLFIQLIKLLTGGRTE